MFIGTYRLAGHTIRIDSIFDEVQTLCRDYATTQSPEFCVTTTAAEIADECRQSDAERQLEGLPPYRFPDSYLETLVVYRHIAEALRPMGVLLMHGSVIAVDGQGYMFTALSGTGKSTHVRLWRQLFGERAVMVNDDKPLVYVPSDPAQPAVVYGTPWDGKHHLSTNIAVPLKAIVELNRGSENQISRITPMQMFSTLMQQTFRTSDTSATLHTMQLLGQLSERVAFYRLHCNMNPEAALVAYQGMNE